MKKTIIALLALAGVAAADSITLPGNTDYTWVAGSNANGIGTGAVTADIVKNLADAITAAGVDWTGWFGGTGQGYGADSYGSDISITSGSSFSFTCRPALSGEYVALGVALPGAAESITLSFDTNNKLGYSVWSYDGTTATELIGSTYQSGSGSVSQTYSTDTVEASQLFVLWTANHSSGNAGGGAGITVSNIQLSYSAAPSASVPEPTTATLSLLALAGLAARRRR